MSKELAKKDEAAVAVDERQAQLDALRAQQEEEFDSGDYAVPILKIGQPLTKEVQDDNLPAEAGDFINTLTGASLGKQIEFIVAYYQKGRFAVDRESNRAFVAFGDLIPERWADLKIVGESFVGTRFDQHPDAEEQFKVAVNEKRREWGKGPAISTTHNYTGLVLAEVRDDLDQVIEGEYELQPVRLSLQRTNMGAVRKINSLRSTFLRSPKMFWDRLFVFSTEKKTFAQGSAHLLVPTLGRATSDEEKEAAIELSLAVAAGRVSDNQDGESAADAPAAPDAKGGLAV
jgi:hypothetical protein